MGLIWHKERGKSHHRKYGPMSLSLPILWTRRLEGNWSFLMCWFVHVCACCIKNEYGGITWALGWQFFCTMCKWGAIKRGELEQWSFGAGKEKTIAHFGGWGLHSGKSYWIHWELLGYQLFMESQVQVEVCLFAFYYLALSVIPIKSSTRRIKHGHGLWDEHCPTSSLY